MMVKYYLPIVLLVFFFQGPVSAVNTHESRECPLAGSSTQLSLSLERKELESQLGRKLRFKEQIAVSILKSRITKSEKRALRVSSQNYEPVTDGFAIAGFVCGIMGLIVFGLLFGILAIVFSAISLSRIKKFEGLYKGRGLANAGLVMGIIGLSLSVIILLGWALTV